MKALLTAAAVLTILAASFFLITGGHPLLPTCSTSTTATNPLGCPIESGGTR